MKIKQTIVPPFWIQTIFFLASTFAVHSQIQGADLAGHSPRSISPSGIELTEKPSKKARPSDTPSISAQEILDEAIPMEGIITESHSPRLKRPPALNVAYMQNLPLRALPGQETSKAIAHLRNPNPYLLIEWMRQYIIAQK